MTNAMNQWITKAICNLRKAYRNRCFLCDKKGKLEFAHIKPTDLSGRGRGRKERYYNIKNNPASYMLLCRSCHEAFDKQ